jgi:hypothetical protein
MENILNALFLELKTLIYNNSEKLRNHKNNIDFDIEKMAIHVYKCMEGNYRNFHTTQHIFDINKNLSDYARIAAIYHDIVYLQVDRGLGNNSVFLDKFITTNNNNEGLIVDSEERTFKDILKVFGYEKGQKININNGLNEFLSALVMAESLKFFLNIHQILHIASIIESTIPFRENNLHNLKGRLNNINLVKKQDIETILKDCVDMSNSDVNNFMQDASIFIDNTWKLIQESNKFSNKFEIYCIDDYMNVLINMETFLIKLNFRKVFHNMQNEGKVYPTNYVEMTTKCRKNIKTALHYIHCKIYSIVLLHVIDRCTIPINEDYISSPISLFLGYSSNNDKEVIIDNYLPKISVNKNYMCNKMILNLLAKGRKTSSSDLNHSPLASFIYSSLGIITLERRYNEAINLLKDPKRDECLIFLKNQPKEMTHSILVAIKEICLSRKIEIDILINLVKL